MQQAKPRVYFTLGVREFDLDLAGLNDASLYDVCHLLCAFDSSSKLCVKCHPDCQLKHDHITCEDGSVLVEINPLKSASLSTNINVTIFIMFLFRF